MSYSRCDCYVISKFLGLIEDSLCLRKRSMELEEQGFAEGRGEGMVAFPYLVDIGGTYEQDVDDAVNVTREICTVMHGVR